MICCVCSSNEPNAKKLAHRPARGFGVEKHAAPLMGTASPKKLAVLISAVPCTRVMKPSQSLMLPFWRYKRTLADVPRSIDGEVNKIILFGLIWFL